MEWLVAGLGMALFLAGCAVLPAAADDRPGFIQGFFQGFIAIASLAGRLFFHIRVYTSPNSGFVYDLGFMIGFSTSILILVLSLMPRIGGYITTKWG